jgi:hypothetical protein
MKPSHWVAVCVHTVASGGSCALNFIDQCSILDVPYELRDPVKGPKPIGQSFLKCDVGNSH